MFRFQISFRQKLLFLPLFFPGQLSCSVFPSKAYLRKWCQWRLSLNIFTIFTKKLPLKFWNLTASAAISGKWFWFHLYNTTLSQLDFTRCMECLGGGNPSIALFDHFSYGPFEDYFPIGPFNEDHFLIGPLRTKLAWTDNGHLYLCMDSWRSICLWIKFAMSSM